VQKARLVARIAELLQAKKLSLLADVRDESAEDVRLILEPKSRTVDPQLLMEQMFKLTELETRVPLNMNVLSHGKIPNVLGLRQVLQEWLDHRLEVLVRRSKFRLAKIDHRLEVLAGYLIVYLNLDKVIKIIREKDEPKPALMKAFKLTEVQAEAILNMRLRALRKLEEMEIKREHDDLTKERKELNALLRSTDKQWNRIGDEIKGLKEQFGQKTEIGRRRTSFAEAPDDVAIELAEAMIEKEPVTIVLSEKGWLRSIKGHAVEEGSLAFKEGDRLKTFLRAQTTDTLLLFATNGRFYSLAADKLPGGRGHGEPFRLMVDIEDAGDCVQLFVYEPGRKLLVASESGYGFIVAEDEVIAMTRKGKQILNVKSDDEAAVCTPVEGDSVAVIGANRKLLLFPLKELPEMPRGKGVRLQRYKDGGLADAKTFTKKEGLTYLDAAKRSFTLSSAELRDWWGARAQAGRLPPRGFPKSGKFGDRF
jgi:topoisomerase IV subunit A